FKSATESITLPDVVISRDCSQGYLPDGISGKGIGFTNGAIGAPYLFDLDSILGCVDFVPDFILAIGTCAQPLSPFDTTLSLTGAVLPQAVCLRRVAESEGGQDLTVLSFGETTMLLSVPVDLSVMRVEFDAALPSQAEINGLIPGEIYRLTLTVTDG